MPLINAVFPAPWWTPLSYECGEELPEGIRVLAPLGKGSRVGVSMQTPADGTDIKHIKHVSKIIDAAPPLPEELWRLIKWFGKTWFAGTGFAMKTLLPSKFFSEEEFPQVPQGCCVPGRFSSDYFYNVDSRVRWEFYADLLKKSVGASLVLFPEVSMASDFWKSLPKGLKDSGALWPASGARQWDLWKHARNGGISFIAGSPGASFVPLAGLSMIIMDEENQGGWRTQSRPVFHARHLLGMRASFAGARFVLGGMMPSSKCFMNASPECSEKNNSGLLVFVSLKEASALEFSSMRDTLPISAPLIRETREARHSGKWAMWLLDRKGYAGEVSCDECGNTVRCRRCGSVMRWEDGRNRLCCVSCSFNIPVPEKCPNCGGRLLSGARPGLEALFERTRGALRGYFKNILLFQNQDDKIPKSKDLLEKYPEGALIIGTRKLISLCGDLPTGLVGWVDADMEARSDGYDAKARAYSMIWESMWRGGAKKIVVQSRRPGRGWQEGLTSGWGRFWKNELDERVELDLPPFTPMLRITFPYGAAGEFALRLDAKSIDYWASEETENEIWVRTKRFSEVESALRPYFDISRSGKGFPSVLLYLD